MARGYKTGRSTSGTPNHKTQAVIDRLEALGCDPIEGHGKDCDGSEGRDEHPGADVQGIGAYVAPKSPIEISGGKASPVPIRFSWAES